MNIATWRSMSVSELHDELKKQLKSRFGLQQGLRAGEVREIHKYRAARKAVARIKTLLVEKSKELSKKVTSDKK